MRTVQDVATAVRLARKERGLTQAQVAERAGVGRDWVVRLEQGNPRLELSKVLDVVHVLGLEITLSDAPEPDEDPFAAVFQTLT
ncbi:MAG TPA: type II toxin-antitoxin system Y4mF family antitoxin [Arachnia sp.]|nr:type II toxin-antitoxin system Y4mF family antitoxin [Arachnia sp.]HMT86590.1 type II toxin-antitoxin system Y4mF family antitoxin [Arachnia sp.]